MATLSWRQLRDESVARLAAAGIEDPASEFRWIAERASGRTPAEQAADLDAPATVREVTFVDQMVSRRAAGEPLQYVLGRWGFRTLDLLVDQRVLIPRPETEVVAGHAIDAVQAIGRPAVVADLGTGSGAIALAVAAECWPHVEVWATDASSDALAVARANLSGLGRRAGVVRLTEGDWFAALPDDLRGRIDVVVSNPPYVGDAEPLPSEVADWEPAAALRAGSDGLDAIRRIIEASTEWLAPDGALVLEIGETQGPAVLALARDAGFRDASVAPDLTGRDRAVIARLAAGTPVRSAADPDVVDAVEAALRGGGVVVLPTDTVYGLAALAADPAAVSRLFDLKGRRTETPIAVLCADAEQAIALAASDLDPRVASTADRWWPGPLTLVLPRREGVVLDLGGASTTVGLRVPDHDLVRAVAARVGPVATTSANRHGEPTATTAAEVLAALGPGVALVVDGGPLTGTASTVVDATAAPWRVLREGAIPAAEVLGDG